MKKTILILLIFGFALSPLLASAQTNPCSMSAVSGNTVSSSALPQCINQVYVWSLGIGALLALLMTVAGGYYVMTSSGNAEQASRGKEMITGAVIGLALLFGAYLILQTINPDLVNLRFNSVTCLDPANNNNPECQSAAPASSTPSLPKQ